LKKIIANQENYLLKFGNKLFALLLDCPKLYFDYLKHEFEISSFDKIDINKIIDIKSFNLLKESVGANLEKLFYDNYLVKFLNLFWCAIVTKYAVFIANNVIILVGDYSFKIQLNLMPEMLTEFSSKSKQFIPIIENSVESQNNMKQLVSFERWSSFSEFSKSFLKNFIEEEEIRIEFSKENIID
jgi:hypothetical protein